LHACQSDLGNAAVFVDRVLEGQKPGESPFEWPIKFELVMDLKTASAPGIKVPPSIYCAPTA